MDHCGDNSDEFDCGMFVFFTFFIHCFVFEELDNPNSTCKLDEYQCESGNQCTDFYYFLLFHKF